MERRRNIIEYFTFHSLAFSFTGGRSFLLALGQTVVNENARERERPRELKEKEIEIEEKENEKRRDLTLRE